MAGYFFDSSALAKFYHPEIGTPVVDRIIQSVGNKIWISRLTVVEMYSVFAIKVRSQVVSRQDASALLRRFKEELVIRGLGVVEIREAELASAQQLLEKHAFDRRLRSLDAIQLAVALGLESNNMTDHFVSADKALCEVAALDGLSVINPELP